MLDKHSLSLAFLSAFSDSRAMTMLGKLVCCYGNGYDATGSAFMLHCQIQCKEINEGEISRLLYLHKEKIKIQQTLILMMS